MTDKDESYVILDKSTGEIIFHFTDKNIIRHVNTKKYKVMTILDFLVWTGVCIKKEK